MASFSERTKLETAVAAEATPTTIATIKTYYAAYVQEQLNPVSWEDYLAVVENYFRKSGITT